MTIDEFIRKEALLPWLQKAEVLVIYEPDRRYRELCLAERDMCGGLRKMKQRCGVCWKRPMTGWPAVNVGVKKETAVVMDVCAIMGISTVMMS